MLTMIIAMVIVSIIVICGFIFGVIRAYKIRPAKCAHDYLDRNSVHYRQKSDTYIRTYVNKVRIQTNSNNNGRR